MLVSTSSSASGGGLSVASSASVEVPTMANINTSVAAAKAGSLTTRTDANTGTLTMDTGHGIATGNRIDIHWLDPTTGAAKCQYKVTVGTVATNSVPIDLGVGDDLPTAATSVTAFVVTGTDIDYFFEETNLSVLACGGSSGRAKVVLEKADGTVVFNATVGVGGSGYTWTLASGASNPVSDTVAKAWISNGESTIANTVTVLAGLIA